MGIVTYFIELFRDFINALLQCLDDYFVGDNPTEEE